MLTISCFQQVSQAGSEGDSHVLLLSAQNQHFDPFMFFFFLQARGIQQQHQINQRNYQHKIYAAYESRHN